MAYIHLLTYSECLHTKTDIRVILPTPLAGESVGNYYGEDRRFPVLYLLHGTYGTGGDYTRFSRIESYAQDYNVAVVMMDTGNGCYRDTPRGGPAYYQYVTEELPQMMQWMFPISAKREENFICGLSMGGTGAFKIGFSCPEKFGWIACMSANFSGWQSKADADDSVWSSAFLPGENLTNTYDDLYDLARKAVNSAVELPNLYICCGQQDFLFESNEAFRKHLENLGVRHTYHVQPGSHNWDFWDDELRRILAWLPIECRKSKSMF